MPLASQKTFIGKSKFAQDFSEWFATFVPREVRATTSPDEYLGKLSGYSAKDLGDFITNTTLSLVVSGEESATNALLLAGIFLGEKIAERKAQATVA